MRGNLHFERSATRVRRTWHPTLRPTCESEMRGHSHGGSTSKSLRAIRTLANCIASCLATHVRGFGGPANRLATHPAIGPRPYRARDQIETNIKKMRSAHPTLRIAREGACYCCRRFAGCVAPCNTCRCNAPCNWLQGYSQGCSPDEMPGEFQCHSHATLFARPIAGPFQGPFTR